jgi:hypothetical protein
MLQRHIVLIGGGGHASDVLSAFEAANLAAEVIGYADGDGETRLSRDITYLGDIGQARHIDARFILALGWPSVRARFTDYFTQYATIIHPKALCHRRLSDRLPRQA